MNSSPLSSSVHGILQARKLECVALPFSMRSYQSRDKTFISCIAGGFFTSELPGKMEEPGVHGVTKSWTRLSDFTFIFTREDQLYETSAWALVQISIEAWLLLPIIAFYYFFFLQLLISRVPPIKNSIPEIPSQDLLWREPNLEEHFSTAFWNCGQDAKSWIKGSPALQVDSLPTELSGKPSTISVNSPYIFLVALCLPP